MSGVTIGIDARKIRDYGIGRHLEGLLRALAADGGDERYVLFAFPDPGRALPPALREALPDGRFRIVPLAAPLYSVRELLAFRGAAGRLGLDLLHFPHYVRGVAPGCPVIVTIHDAIHLSHPPSPAARLYARVMLHWAARSADCLLTVSAAARDDLSRRLRVPPDRFRITPNGVDAPFAPPDAESVSAFRTRRGLPDRFVLCAASHRPHKNLRAALSAFARADLGDASLVIAARDGKAAAHLAPLAGGPNVRVLDHVEDRDLPLLYAAARIVLCPSLAEGFGLPALEAAACGAAVLATPLDAHREILGDAAVYTRSGHDADLAEGLAALWMDDATLATLRHRGPERSSLFRWSETARRTRRAYLETIEVSRRGDLC